MFAGYSGLQQESISRLLMPWTFATDVWRHRVLIRQFAVREIQGRYRGSALGMAWSFATPLAMLVIYTFVFGKIFQSRWKGLPEEGWQGLLSFGVAMFAGSTAFSIFSEPVGRAAGLIAGVPNYVKKVVFPLEVLPVAVLLTALFHACVAFLLVLIGALLVLGKVPWTALLLPVMVIPATLLAAGVTWFLASLGVYLRDAGQAVGVILQILFFATPIFYPTSKIDESVRWVLYLNPLTYCVEIVRDVLVIGQLPDVKSLVLAFVCGIVVAQAGYAWFMLTKRGFADVL